MKLKSYVFVNGEWWRVFQIEKFSEPTAEADIGERQFYESLKKHKVLYRNDHGRWNPWIGNGTDFVVISGQKPLWVPQSKC